jgi:hypothetical protein
MSSMLTSWATCISPRRRLLHRNDTHGPPSRLTWATGTVAIVLGERGTSHLQRPHVT